MAPRRNGRHRREVLRPGRAAAALVGRACAHAATIAAFIAAAFIAATFVAAAPAEAAKAPALHAEHLVLTAGADDGLGTASAAGGDSSAFAATFAYARRSLAFSSAADGVRRVEVVLGDLLIVDLGYLRRFGRWTVEVALPVALVERGGGPALLGVDRPMAPAFGDARLGGRVHLWSRSDVAIGSVDAALRALYFAPTGADGGWLTSGGLRLDLGPLLSWRRGAMAADLELALRLQPVQRLVVDRRDASGATVVGADGVAERDTVLASGSRFVARARFAYSIDAIGVSAGVEGQTQVDVAGDATGGQWHAEGMAVAGWTAARSPLTLYAAFGGSATHAWGSPQLRLLAGVRLRPDRFASDRDGDGLDDRDDRCPDQAEDADGFEDGDGCPDLDDDGDGVADSRDRCRLDAEDSDGFEDGDGCPDLDDDGDGIPDAVDACPRAAAGGPTSAEDVDGFEDGDGCPDPDNDGDGVLDGDDLCPLAPETVNGFEDVDGCPDEAAPPLVSIDAGRILLARPLRFEPGTARLDGDAKALVATIAAVLRATPAIKGIEVAVYLDDSGSPAERLQWSQARADAVKAALVSVSGLAPHQIRAIGMGGNAPIAGNEDAHGRSRNRRVELRVLAGPDALAPTQPPPQLAPTGSAPRRRR